MTCDPSVFISQLDELIIARRKMTSPLYQLILSGQASLTLLSQFVIHRYPIKAFWSRNILGIAARINDYALRRELIENIYEEETGAISNTQRHLETFIDFGLSLGLSREQITQASPTLPETTAVVEHNVGACNHDAVHFTVGVASVLLLMEGQPAITNDQGASMEAVMRDIYLLPPSGYAYFSQHASGSQHQSVSEIEADHASTARRILARYCVTAARRVAAKSALEYAIELRHSHFDAILRVGVNSGDGEPPFRWTP